MRTSVVYLFIKRLKLTWRWNLVLLSGICLAFLLVSPVTITAKNWQPDDIYKASWFTTLRPFNAGKGEDDREIDPFGLRPGIIVWAYLRHSPGPNQDITSQKAAVIKYVDEHGWILGRMFCDERASGKSTAGREQFKLMIHLARQRPRPADAIIVWNFSRFARELEDSQYFRSDLRRNGWKFISMTDEIPDNEWRPLIEVVKDIENQQFRKDLGRNTKRGLDLLADLGFVPAGQVATGYAYDSTPYKVKPDGTICYGRKPYPDPKVAPLVVKAFKMRASGAPYAVISRETKLFGPEPGPWRTFFRNRIYIGEYSYGGRTFYDIYPALISKELFEAVQKQMPERKVILTTKQLHPRRKGSSYYVADKATCGYCGALMEGKKIGKMRYYICSRRNERMDLCPEAQPLPAEELELNITNMLQQHIVTTEFLQSLLVWTNENLNQGLAELQLRIDATERASSEARKLAIQYGKNFGQLPEYSEIAAQLLLNQEGLVKELQKELDEMKDKLANSRIEVTSQEIEEYVSRTQALISGGEFFDLRELCGQTFSRIIMTGDECKLEIPFPTLNNAELALKDWRQNESSQ